MAPSTSAGNDHGRQILAEQFRGPRGTVGVEIVVAQNDDGVGVFQGIFDHQASRRRTAAVDGAPGRILPQHRQKQQRDQRGDDSPALRCRCRFS